MRPGSHSASRFQDGRYGPSCRCAPPPRMPCRPSGPGRMSTNVSHTADQYTRAHWVPQCPPRRIAHARVVRWHFVSPESEFRQIPVHASRPRNNRRRENGTGREGKGGPGQQGVLARSRPFLRMGFSVCLEPSDTDEVTTSCCLSVPTGERPLADRLCILSFASLSRWLLALQPGYLPLSLHVSCCRLGPGRETATATPRHPSLMQLSCASPVLRAARNRCKGRPVHHAFTLDA